MQHSNWAKRWFVAFPLFSAAFAGLLTIAPLGWIALLGASTGTAVDHVQVGVVSIGEASRSRGCDLRADLEFRGTRAKICMEGLFPGPPPRARETVMVAGRLSYFGLYIERIERQ